tara:strand:- start:1121 stop:1222 length:102 start_codon:yes stop_codon:yes gene_type:complete
MIDFGRQYHEFMDSILMFLEEKKALFAENSPPH